MSQVRQEPVRQLPVSYLEDAARALWLADQLLGVCRAVLHDNQRQLSADSRQMLETVINHEVAGALPATRENIVCFLIGV